MGPAGNTREESGESLVMVRYGETFLKSEPVKHHFIGILLRNIRHALSAHGISARCETPRGRILIHGDEPEKIAGIVSRVFGVVDVSICSRTGNIPEDLCAEAISLASAHLSAGMSFAVRVKRQKKTGPTSQELGTGLGLLYGIRSRALRWTSTTRIMRFSSRSGTSGGWYTIHESRRPAACPGAPREGSSSSFHPASILPLHRGLR